MIKISVQSTIYSDIIDGMRNNQPWAAPIGTFYQLAGNVVPYSPKPTILRIETDRIGEAFEIEVGQANERPIGVDIRKNINLLTFVANAEVTTIGVQLTRGLNSVIIRSKSEPEEVEYLLVRATTVITLWEAFARVLYARSKKIINEQKNAVNSKLATRLVEPFIDFRDLFPDLQSLQILATRLAVRGTVHSVGLSSGVNDLIKSLSLGTPVFKSMDKDYFELYPALDPWTKNASQFGGKEAHIWYPNVGVANWLAFLGYISNQPDLFEIISISEDEVVLKYQNEIQRHQFDSEAFGTEFLTSLAQADCFKSIRISINMHTNHVIKICAASYTFDLVVTEDSPIGNCRISLDLDQPFDSGCTFDSDEVDPFSDGWVGLSLTGRFEQDYPENHCLDTFVQPSTAYIGPDCCYESLYTQLVANQRYDIDLEVDPEIEGYVQTGIMWTLQSPDLTKWDIKINGLGQLVAIPGSIRNPDSFKVTRPDLVEVSFAITNGGELQVIQPSIGVNLNDTIYIRAFDSTIWWVRVDNSNTIYTTRIF